MQPLKEEPKERRVSLEKSLAKLPRINSWQTYLQARDRAEIYLESGIRKMAFIAGICKGNRGPKLVYDSDALRVDDHLCIQGLHQQETLLDEIKVYLPLCPAKSRNYKLPVLEETTRELFYPVQEKARITFNSGIISLIYIAGITANGKLIYDVSAKWKKGCPCIESLSHLSACEEDIRYSQPLRSILESVR